MRATEVFARTDALSRCGSEAWGETVFFRDQCSLRPYQHFTRYLDGRRFYTLIKKHSADAQ
jgi:hypothetical protein